MPGTALKNKALQALSTGKASHLLGDTDTSMTTITVTHEEPGIFGCVHEVIWITQ